MPGRRSAMANTPNSITLNADGRYEVADPNQRATIMRLRDDPAASATMAGAFTQTNAAQLAATIGRQPTEGELYIAHFLGSDGAAKLINAAASQPAASAAAIFPQAAAANPTIFMNRTGQPCSVSEVYATLTGRFAVARAIAVAPGLRGSQTAPAVSLDTAGVTQAFAQANSLPPANPVPLPAMPPEARPFFQGMFSDRGNRAVTQTVSDLWALASPMRRRRPRSCTICSAIRPPAPASLPAARPEAARAAYRIVNGYIISMVNTLLSVVG